MYQEVISACRTQGNYDIHHPHVKPSSPLGSGNLDPNVTPHPKQWQEHCTTTPCSWDQLLFTFSADSWPSRDLWSLANWGPENLFPQLLRPHIPPNSGAHLLSSFPPFPLENSHTHTNIIFLPFDVYFNRSHQFPMLVWESVFSGLAIYKKADLWRHNSKCLTFYLVTGCSAFTSQGSLTLGWLSLPSLLILPHILVLFSALIQFLIAEEQKKLFAFLVFFTFFDWVAYDRIFFFKFPFRGHLTLMVILHALKDKRRVLDLMKGYNIWV